MSGIAKTLKEMKANPRGVRFNNLQKFCTHYFGKPRQSGSSHCVYKTPWPGDPRVNIQNQKGKAKPYQVLLAIEKLRYIMVLESDKYTYRVLWSEEDEEFIGLCTEFPSLSWLASSAEKALKGIRAVVKACILDMKKSDEELPLPLSTRKYSGKFMVRVPPEVHRHLAIEAAESGVSLNRIASAKLAH